MTAHPVDLAHAHQAELRRRGARRAATRAAVGARKNRHSCQETR